ncbi:MAG: hypothetical protein M1834_001442 [Cirrosporium novae-zelandiae]|nr:MAG: hypothetical protein M1834_001442 [Cirrosporium novae-zelandiae]
MDMPSSQISMQGFDACRQPYRTAKALPHLIRQNATIYLEEELYNQALNTLVNHLSSGNGTLDPAFVPPPEYLALISTLVVHPSLNTRATTPERVQASNAALNYLYSVLHIAGPINAKFDQAFTFTYFNRSRNGKKQHWHDTDKQGEQGPDAINSNIADAGSLWNCAEGFWSVVGWAFNCSVLYPKRWERWQVWLEFMCQTMEDDWAERLRYDKNSDHEMDDPDTIIVGRVQKATKRAIEDSLIIKYLTPKENDYTLKRKVLRAIFSEGNKTDTNEFGEIFRNETKKLTKEDTSKKVQQVDIDRGIYGDYLDELDDDDDDDEEIEKQSNRTRSRKPTTSTNRAINGSTNRIDGEKHISPDDEVMGGPDSLLLRQRLLGLLSTVSNHLPNKFMTPDALYDDYVEKIRPLPLPAFQAFVFPSVLPHFAPNARSSLCQCLLNFLLEPSAPKPITDHLTQDLFEYHYLPYAANVSSVANNAKVSITIEALMRLLLMHSALKPSERLMKALKRGILARTKKAKGKKRDQYTPEEESEAEYLKMSAERMTWMLGVVATIG